MDQYLLVWSSEEVTFPSPLLNFKHVLYLLENFMELPVMILCCIRFDFPLLIPVPFLSKLGEGIVRAEGFEPLPFAHFLQSYLSEGHLLLPFIVCAP